MRQVGVCKAFKQNLLRSKLLVRNYHYSFVILKIIILCWFSKIVSHVVVWCLRSLKTRDRVRIMPMLACFLFFF